MTLSEYLEITTASAERQWREITARAPRTDGKRGAPFVPVETLLCAAAMHVVEYSRLGSSTMHRAGSPAPELAALFRRPVSSIIAKMNNLDGSRPRGAKFDLSVGLVLTGDAQLMTVLYRRLLLAARRVGIGYDALPDFLGLEGGGELSLLGQDELDDGALGDVLTRELPLWLERSPDQSESVTERYLLQYLRVGQHRFATGVLQNCGNECVFCGFGLGDSAKPTLLRAGHIKPWRDSDGHERLDITNGLAACPTHDAAFDSGLMTVRSDPPHLAVTLSARMRHAVETNAAVATTFGPAGLRTDLQTSAMAVVPAVEYLDWHAAHVFA
ncbi:putative restriction endonuclease [Serinibacter salmoneus]|uniref:Putative restriction endonuclease n=2 Tax=Serinibacter salmoneus TaxID=556530 RepID=A0A2A9CWI7_9MICO|nr:putative restriction endonuclease [Serinibacter salmoneus]